MEVVVGHDAGHDRARTEEEDMEICVKKIPFATLGSSFPYSDLLSPRISYTYLDLLFQNVLTRSIFL